MSSEDEILDQGALIRRKEWDCLILLDACRYDYFEEVYGDYLEGKLLKANSGCSSTPEWLVRNFEEGYEDVVYISANPYINSKGIEAFPGIDGSDLFHKIIDVWEDGWDDELGSVPPKEMRKTALLSKAENPKRRMIVHFMQPHSPYISLESSAGGFLSEELHNGEDDARQENLLDRIRSFVKYNAGRLLGHVRVARIGQRIRWILGGTGPRPSEIVARRYGENALREAYEENLRVALSEVEKIASRLPGRTVVTSDHGELLGENGKYGHPIGLDDETLFEVPWLEVGE